jgi:hypothetical protein
MLVGKLLGFRKLEVLDSSIARYGNFVRAFDVLVQCVNYVTFRGDRVICRSYFSLPFLKVHIHETRQYHLPKNTDRDRRAQ